MPGSRRYPWWRVKIHRSYTVQEIVDMTGKHRETVRGWIRSGRLPTIGNGKPYFVHGAVLREFLKPRRTPCPPGTFYCLRCKVPRRPRKRIVIYRPSSPIGGLLMAPCQECGAAMRRRTAKEKIPVVMPGLTVRTESGP